MRIITDHPVAYDSPDHTTPRGTINDNSFNRVFNDKLVAVCGNDIRVLDLGCSGGGFVKSLVDQGVDAYGIEGSDISRRTKRAEWATIPERLFTADITKPFTLLSDDTCSDQRRLGDRSVEYTELPFRCIEQGSGSSEELGWVADDKPAQFTADITKPFSLVGLGEEQPQQFDVITLWEVLEHIAEADLPGVFASIRQHLHPTGRLIVSISPNDDIFEGVNLHQTVRSFEWWVAKIHSFGWSHMPRMVQWFSPDWVRGRMGFRFQGSEALIDSDAWNSFHLVLERDA